MKTLLLAATVTLLGATSWSPQAAASPGTSLDARALYTCAGKALSRVALSETPHECCNGMLGCPQLLANTNKLKIRRDNRT